MKPNPDDLENVIHQALRSLPDRRAPGGLESRVMAEIARRAALPWWKRSWNYWPAPVRWLFLLFTATLSAVAIVGCVALFRENPTTLLVSTFSRPIQIFSALLSAWRSITGTGADLAGLIPQQWFYGFVLGFAAVYGTVLLIGAAAYRTLWQNR